MQQFCVDLLEKNKNKKIDEWGSAGVIQTTYRKKSQFFINFFFFFKNRVKQVRSCVLSRDHKHGQCHVGVKESDLHLDKKELSTQGYKGLAFTRTLSRLASKSG